MPFLITTSYLLAEELTALAHLGLFARPTKTAILRAGYKFIFVCHSLQRWERQAWNYQARDSHKKQINGPEGTVSRKHKIFSSFTQRDEEGDRNIPSIYPLFVNQNQHLTLLTTQVKTYTWFPICFRHANGTRRYPNTRGWGGGYLLIRG